MWYISRPQASLAPTGDAPEGAARRGEILDAIVDHVLESGAADLSVRRIAEAIGTSHRMLLYYFGSKDQLLREIYTALRRRFQGLVLEAAAVLPPGDRVSIGRMLWNAMLADPRVLPLMGELVGLALLEPRRYGDMAAEHVRQLVATNEAIMEGSGVPSERRAAIATVAVASIRGLQLDLLATGDRDRVEAAFAELEGLMTMVRKTWENDDASGER